MNTDCAVPGTQQMGMLCNMPYYGDPVKMQADHLATLRAEGLSDIFLFIVFLIVAFIIIIVWRFRLWELKYSFKNRLELVRSVTDPDYHEDRSKTFVRLAGLYDPFIGALTSAQSERENAREVKETGKAVRDKTVFYEQALEEANSHGMLKLIHQLIDNKVTDREISKALSGRLSAAQIAALREHYQNQE